MFPSLRGPKDGVELVLFLQEDVRCGDGEVGGGEGFGLFLSFPLEGRRGGRGRSEGKG